MSPVTPVLLLQQPMKIHPSILAEGHHNSAPEEVDAPLVDAKYQLAWQQPNGILDSLHREEDGVACRCPNRTTRCPAY